MSLAVLLLFLAACQPLSGTPVVTIAGATPTPSATRIGTPTQVTHTPSAKQGSAPTTDSISAEANTTRSPAANADVLFVRAVLAGDGSWTFSVTVEHPDTGWDDYADGWDVVTSDGTVIKPNPDSPYTRLLTHPHETEQPFTRSQSGIRISTEKAWVCVRAHDLVDGFGGREVCLDLTVESGSDFEVER